MASSRIQTHCFLPIEPFDGTNHFRRWQESILLCLRTLGIGYVLFDRRPSSADAAEQWDRDDALCRGHILHTLADCVFDVHIHRSTAKNLWDALHDTYVVEERCSSFRRFTRFVMVDDEPILEQVAKFHALASDVNSKGVVFPEKYLVRELILKLPPPSWSEAKMALLINGRDLSMEEVCMRIRRLKAYYRFADEQEEEEGADKRENAGCKVL